MMKELEVAQDLRSKLEKNYRDEVAVLNDKVRQLNEYIEDMEAKNNDRLRNSVPGEVIYKVDIKVILNRSGGRMLHQIDLSLLHRTEKLKKQR